MNLSGKVIFIISYENWGAMRMSKHHYAIELAKAGNTVYFINHPDKRKELKRGQVQVLKTEFDNLFHVVHRLFHPYFFKFRLNHLYNLLTAFHIRKLIRIAGKYPDIVWSFDAGNSIPLKYFYKSAVKIFMPVDGPFGHDHEKRAAEDADVIISVTETILNAYKKFNKPKLLVNHGVADVFLYSFNERRSDDTIRVGYSGSLIRSDLDTKIFLKLINCHQDKVFEFWGEYDYLRSNIHLPQDISDDTIAFLVELKKKTNVILHGPVSSNELANGLNRMDVLLINYNIKNDQNHHKVLEYLATGNVIVSNYMSSYCNDHSALIEMVCNPESNDELPGIFKKVVENLQYYNSEEMRAKRKNHACKFSYLNNLLLIQGFLEKINSN